MHIHAEWASKHLLLLISQTFIMNDSPTYFNIILLKVVLYNNDNQPLNFVFHLVFQ